jgi:hypothetical protein
MKQREKPKSMEEASPLNMGGDTIGFVENRWLALGAEQGTTK